MTFYRSFFHKIWLSTAALILLAMILLQGAYTLSVHQIKEEWEFLYENHLRDINESILAVAEQHGLSVAQARIDELTDYKEYFKLYQLTGRGSQLKPVEITSNTMQVVYFNDRYNNLGVLELKNLNKTPLFFSYTLTGFFIRSLPMLVIGVAFAYFWVRRMSKPLSEIATFAKKIGQGDLDIRLPESLTSQKNEIGDFSTRFNYMIDNIHDLQMTQKRMLTDIAHELRSPLSRQKLAINFLRNPTIQEDNYRFQEYLDRVEQEGERLNELIEEVVTYLRDSDHRTAHWESVSLSQLLVSVINDANFEYSQKEKRVKAHLPSNILVKGNYIQLERAIENIIRNALFHTAKGTEVIILLQDSNQKATLDIIDFGKGVSKEQLKLLTRPFYRTDDARNSRDGGYGLGLAIANEIIHNHHGSLDFKAHSSGGLQVTITLPLA